MEEGALNIWVLHQSYTVMQWSGRELEGSVAVAAQVRFLCEEVSQESETDGPSLHTEDGKKERVS